MTPRGSFWIVATATADGLLYERLDQALAWADRHDRQGTELFVGVNARSKEGKTKASVRAVTCCFADLDLAGQGTEDALAVLTDGPTPPPSFIVHSGYGLHAVWLLREPNRDKARWRVIQRAILRTFPDYGADPVCAPATRAAPGMTLPRCWMPSRHQRPRRFTTSQVRLPRSRPHPRQGGPARAGVTLLDRYIRTMFKPGLHFGIIPVAGQENSKPTLLKPGAEMICLLFGWRARFSADLPILQMYGPGTTGVFALVCELIDRQGQVVGQGTGVAELREPSMISVNMAVKLAEKRAYVDAVLRAAGLSQYFTQGSEDMVLLPPSPDASEAAMGAESGARVRLCTERQRQAIRALLGRAGQTEDWLLAKLHLGRALARRMPHPLWVS